MSSVTRLPRPFLYVLGLFSLAPITYVLYVVLGLSGTLTGPQRLTDLPVALTLSMVAMGLTSLASSFLVLYNIPGLPDSTKRRWSAMLFWLSLVALPAFWYKVIRMHRQEGGAAAGLRNE